MEDRKPPFVSTAEPGSFARYTLENRFPSIIDGVIKSRSAGSEALERLKIEIREGDIVDPFEAECAASGPRGFEPGLFLPEEIAAWSEEIRLYLGRFWTDLPFYFAEAYFYLRILIASGYYDPASPFFREDPFEPVKDAELARVLASREWFVTVEEFFNPGRTSRIDCSSPPGTEDLYESAVLFMLRGNRIDLSNLGIAERGRKMMHAGDGADLLVDHVVPLVQKIARSQRIDIILDNAGSELTADLLFAWFFLQSVPRGNVVLHAKKAPIFVSDAVGEDIFKTLRGFEGTASSAAVIGRELSNYHTAGRLTVREHHFWNGPKHFTSLPGDLILDLAGSELIVIKGDANYRRLLEDRMWSLDADLADLTGWFPAPFAVLRTLKCEVAADIPRETSDRLFREYPNWLTDGRWGIVRLVLPKG